MNIPSTAATAVGVLAAALHAATLAQQSWPGKPTGDWKAAGEWPLPETRWTPFYFHAMTLYHGETHPSHVFPPITRGNVVGTFLSGGELPDIEPGEKPYAKFHMPKE